MLVLGDNKGRGTVSCVTSEDSPKGVGLNGPGLAGHCRSCKLYQGALLPVGFTNPRLCDQEPPVGSGCWRLLQEVTTGCAGKSMRF